MKIYYRVTYGNIGVFEAAKKWGRLQKGKELPDFKNDGWLKKIKLPKEARSYFTKEGLKKYKKTFYLSHKTVLDKNKIKTKKFLFDGKKKIIYQDKFQLIIK